MNSASRKIFLRPGVLFWKNEEKYYLFDQVSLEQYRINREAYDILQLCNGKYTANEIAELVLKCNKYCVDSKKDMIVSETNKFIGMMLEKNFLLINQDLYEKFIDYIGTGRDPSHFTPGLVYWEVTNACNHNCIMCYNPSCEVTEGELTLNEGIKLIENLHEAGVSCIVFTGGEPTIRSKELVSWIRFCKKFGIETELFTNGTLMTSKMAKELASAGLGYCRVSIHGACAETNDFIMRTPGSFERAKLGIKNLLDAGISTAWSVVANKRNFGELREIIEQAIQLGCHGVVIGSLDLIGRGALQTELELSPDQEAALWRFLDESIYYYGNKIHFSWGADMCKNDAWDYYVNRPELPSIEWKKQPEHYMRYVKNSLCGVGQRSFAITAKGNVTPCPALYDVILGNCRNQDIIKIWNEAPQLVEFRKKLLEDFEHCGNCGMRYACVGGCRANAFHGDGSLFGRDFRRCKVHAKRAQGKLDMTISFYTDEELKSISINPVTDSKYSSWFNCVESEGHGPWIPYIGVINRVKNRRMQNGN